MFNAILSQVTFGTVVVAVIGVFGVLVGVEVVKKGISIVVQSVGGGQVFYGGRHWDTETYNAAMTSLDTYKKRGGSLDRESARRLREWKNDRARKDLF